MPTSYPISFPSSGTALIQLTQPSQQPPIWQITFLGAQTPDNRLTPEFNTAVTDALKRVEKEWDDLAGSDNGQQGGAALVTTAQVEPVSKIWSNGLDFESAISDPEFFDKYLFPMYEKLLSFPIPTVAAVGGHAFAAGFGLAMAHDYRIMNGLRGYLSMNEIDFGAQLPPGLFAVLEAKIRSASVMRKIVLEGHRFSATEAAEAKIVDAVIPAQGSKEGSAVDTLKAAIELAKKLAPKAQKDAWGPNKLVLYHPHLSVLRLPNVEVTSKL